jgi:membrane-associated PAP2 superfamily phosphatase
VLALGLFSARAVRRRWFVVAACSGLLIGMGRMLQGSHFLSDILFAGWLMWAVTVVVREGWLRAALWGLRRRRLRQSQFSPAGFIGRSG